MCALTPLLPSKLGWAPMEYPWLCNVDSLLDPFPSFAHLDDDNYNQDRHSNSNGNSGGGHCNDEGLVMKKLTHNASERDRRKKLNALYSTLRALLPTSDDSKKLSIPGTVSQALKYIPELRQQVERLCRRKEQLVKRISRQTSVSLDQREQPGQRPMNNDRSQKIATTWLTETEIVVQIAAPGKTPFSDTLLGLEETGLRVISVTSSVSSNTRVFHTLHLQMDGDCKVNFEELSDVTLALLVRQDQWHV